MHAINTKRLTAKNRASISDLVRKEATAADKALAQSWGYTFDADDQGGGTFSRSVQLTREHGYAPTIEFSPKDRGGAYTASIQGTMNNLPDVKVGNFYNLAEALKATEDKLSDMENEAQEQGLDTSGTDLKDVNHAVDAIIDGMSSYDGTAEEEANRIVEEVDQTVPLYGDTRAYAYQTALQALKDSFVDDAEGGQGETAALAAVPASLKKELEQQGRELDTTKQQLAETQTRLAQLERQPAEGGPVLGRVAAQGAGAVDKALPGAGGPAPQSGLTRTKMAQAQSINLDDKTTSEYADLRRLAATEPTMLLKMSYNRRLIALEQQFPQLKK